MNRCSAHRRSRRRFCSASRNSRASGSSSRWNIFSDTTSSVGTTCGKQRNSGKQAAEVGVPLEQSLVARAVRRRQHRAGAVPASVRTGRRRRSAPGTARRVARAVVSLPSTTNSRSTNSAAGSRTSVTVSAATTRLASSTACHRAACRIVPLPGRSSASFGRGLPSRASRRPGTAGRPSPRVVVEDAVGVLLLRRSRAGQQGLHLLGEFRRFALPCRDRPPPRAIGRGPNPAGSAGRLPRRPAFDGPRTKLQTSLLPCLSACGLPSRTVSATSAGQVPDAAWLVGLGDGEADLGQVADVVAVPRVHGQDEQVALLDLQRSWPAASLPAEIERPFAEDGRLAGPAVFEPPGDAVAAGRMGVGDPDGDADVRRPPGSSRRRPRTPSASGGPRPRAADTRPGICSTLSEELVTSIGRSVPFLPPAVDGRLSCRSSGSSPRATPAATAGTVFGSSAFCEAARGPAPRSSASGRRRRVRVSWPGRRRSASGRWRPRPRRRDTSRCRRTRTGNRSRRPGRTRRSRAAAAAVCRRPRSAGAARRRDRLAGRHQVAGREVQHHFGLPGRGLTATPDRDCVGTRGGSLATWRSCSRRSPCRRPM